MNRIPLVFSHSPEKAFRNMKKEFRPYVRHVFVCANNRQGGRKSCGEGANEALEDFLKTETGKRGRKTPVRVSNSGCTELCGKGTNVMHNPQAVRFNEVSAGDGRRIPEEMTALPVSDRK